MKHESPCQLKLIENNPSVCSLRSIHLPFQGRQINSSALPGISSIRGDNFAKSPLLEEVARSAGGVRGVPGEPCSPLQGLFKNYYANPGTKKRVAQITSSAAVMITAQRVSSAVNFSCFNRVRPSPPW